MPNNDVRAMHRFPGTIGPLRVRPDGHVIEVGVRDFSIGGAGLVADQPLAQGVVLAIEAGPLGKPEQPLAAEVRHVTQLPDGKWLLGCRFSRYLTIDDLRELRLCDINSSLRASRATSA